MFASALKTTPLGAWSEIGIVSAGIPQEALEKVVDCKERAESWLDNEKHYYALRVVGNSMFPKYLDGDIVIVHRQSICKSRQDCVVHAANMQPTLKTVVLTGDGGLELHPLNPEFEARAYTKDEVRDLPVIISGIVVELRRLVDDSIVK